MYRIKKEEPALGRAGNSMSKDPYPGPSSLCPRVSGEREERERGREGKEEVGRDPLAQGLPVQMDFTL